MIQPVRRPLDIGEPAERKQNIRHKAGTVPEGFGAQLLEGIRRTNMKTRQDQEHDAALEALQPLVGKRVAGVVRTDDDEGIGCFAGLEFEDGTVVWFNQDTEGNGPGWPDVQKKGGR